MSETNSTTPAPSDKPAKPTPDFPLFPHATKRWAKKIKGKMHYFGKWNDPAAALREYQAFLAGKSKPHQPSVRTDRPAKPYPDFPLFPHATKRWARKIKGKIYYFGSWDDPDGALAKYEQQKDDLEAGRTPTPALDTLTPAEDAQRPAPSRPAKPYPDFPLFPHATGRWAKKIRGKLHYFGSWDDPDGALKNYLEQKDDLHAGRKPRVDTREGVTIKDVVNAFLTRKKGLLDSGELSPHTWAKYKTAADLVIATFGKSRLAANLDAEDFAKLRKKMANRWGVYRLADMIQHVRSIFKSIFKHDDEDEFSAAFARPTKQAQRLHRAEQGPKLFTASEIRKLIDGAGVQQRAMILLGINAGFGNTDCANLPLRAVDLENAVISFARPKTGIPRRCILWPETVAALREALANRREPKSEEDASLFFITQRGQSFQASEKDRPIAQVMAWLLRKLRINGRKGLGFYTLRHTFRTVADESKDQPAVDYIMGHEVAHMSSHYRETISDARLRAVADHVRAWLLPSTTFIENVS